MTNYTPGQTARVYRIHPARTYENQAPRAPESIDVMFSKAYNLGLLNNIKMKVAKP